MSDALWCGCRFRTFNVLDDFNREALAIDIYLNLQAQRVIRTLDRIAVCRGYPVKLRMDNGPEFIPLKLGTLAEGHDIEIADRFPGFDRVNSPGRAIFTGREKRPLTDNVIEPVEQAVNRQKTEIGHPHRVSVGIYQGNREPAGMLLFHRA